MAELIELQRILAEESGNRFCPICQTPFKPYHSRQKTCGSDECKKLFHQEYTKKWMIDNREQYKITHAKSNKALAEKKRRLKYELEHLDEAQEHWEGVQSFEQKVADYGDRYGSVQAAKILATVPKINTEV